MQNDPPSPPPVSRAPADPDRLSQRAMRIGLGLAVLGAAWYLMGLYLYVVASVAAVIVAGGVVPYRYSEIVWGVGLLALAAGAYFYVGNQTLAILLGIVGLISVGAGVPRLKGGRRG